MIIGITGARNIEDHNNTELENKGIKYNQKIYDKVYKEIDIMIKYILKEKDLKFSDLKFVSGMARGVDEIFADYAVDRNIPLILSIPDNVESHRRRKVGKIKSQAIKYNNKLDYVNNSENSKINEIGKTYKNKTYSFSTFARNKNIVDESDIVISYKKKPSRGTQDTINYAKKKKKYFGNVEELLKEAEKKYDLSLNNVLNLKIKKDLLKSNNHIIAHGCNCFNTMGAGIAKEIKKQYPEVFKIDNETEKGDRNKLGNYTFADVNKDRIKDKTIYIVNLYSQYTFYDKKDMFSLKAYKDSLNKMINDFLFKRKNNGKIRIGFPAIGLGKANGEINSIFKITNEISNKYKDKNIELNWYFIDKNLISQIIEIELNSIKKNYNQEIENDLK